jgi:hypothetical protein
MSRSKLKFSRDEIWQLYGRSYKSAVRRLQKIPVFCGDKPRFRGLSGWVFEKTIHYCIKKEFHAVGINVKILEEVRLGSRARADLQIGNTLIEIKLSGVYSRGAFKKYRLYRRIAEKAGFSYLFFSGGESYKPNRGAARDVYGRNNTFFLDTTADWRRFIKRLVALLKANRFRIVKTPAIKK